MSTLIGQLLSLKRIVLLEVLFLFAVAHGSEEQRTNLDIITKDALQTNSDQYKEAERELFGRELNTDDWDRMDEEERSENTRKLMTRLKEMRDESRLNAT